MVDSTTSAAGGHRYFMCIGSGRLPSAAAARAARGAWELSDASAKCPFAKGSVKLTVREHMSMLRTNPHLEQGNGCVSSFWGDQVPKKKQAVHMSKKEFRMGT